MTRFTKQLFEVENNTRVTGDIQPAISVDVASRFGESIQAFKNLLGIAEMMPMAEGSTIARCKATVSDGGDAPGEGDVIPLSKVQRTPLEAIQLKLNKRRGAASAELIQSVSAEYAVNKADAELVSTIRSLIKKDFFKMITGGKGTGKQGATLQAAVANTWAKLSAYYEDKDATPIYFVNPDDVSTYLGSANITTQTAFGVEYLENFFNGTAIITSQVTAGTVYGTAKENLNGAYVPTNSGLGKVFGLTYDESGLIGLTHAVKTDRATIETLIMWGVVFFPEDATGVIKTKIAA